MHLKPTIAFIGAGNIAASLIGGLINGGYDAAKIIVSNPSFEKLTALKSKFSVNITNDNAEAVKQADVIVLAVKPNKFFDVCSELRNSISKKQLVISVAAGIQTQQIQQWLDNNISVIRCMPNTPCLIGAGASGLFANTVTSKDEREFAESMMRTVGVTIWVDSEEKIDIVTTLSGSGPAYFLLVFECLIKAGTLLGLDEDQARLLTLQTALGATRMALESDNSIIELRHKVTSPGGTTEAALNILQQNQLETIFLEALSAGKNRAKEMAALFALGHNKAIEERT